ncbi:Quinohemoprotein ethanol dehydrogenase type-1 precursor [Posidoniimonas polymericola]|uniref:Quinohemoprotein ethanol dehydrogenase type-1 n=1 Tax=Posidoniimonas polymericola TaxID=2528002 RepID=A0A5C5YS31_9BACT|nr:PQQ-binding-like beta-propeller repeat protein [Posidoniimonas polymericola]TWT77688.1 Quinohemoprotein ethanol dehydrogenase type-1 precursor [Posidoniimonas polymericola]
MKRLAAVCSLSLASLAYSSAVAQDWPQWRGANRDAKATGFEAPSEWPAELEQRWKVTVGDGVATPSLVGERLYVYAREGGDEVLRCLDASTGDEQWRDALPAAGVGGPASGFAGPRCSPVISGGKVVIMGVEGVISCLDAASGELLWRNDDYRGEVPRFATSSSPLVTAGVCIAQVGSSDQGGMVAFDLATGEKRWEWDGDGPSYASPVLMDIAGQEVVIAPTSRNLVAIDADSGELLREVPYEQGRYNAATPVIVDQLVIYAGPTRGTTAERVTKSGDELTAEPVWKNTDNSLQFNSPVLKDGMLYGLSNLGSLFCVDAESGDTAWTAPLAKPTEPSAQPEAQPAAQQPEQPAEGERGSRRGRRGRRGGGGGYGSVVDAGSVLFALSPAKELVVFNPNAEAFQEVARYKVADSDTYAYPVIAGNRVYIKDADSVILWVIE